MFFKKAELSHHQCWRTYPPTLNWKGLEFFQNCNYLLHTDVVYYVMGSVMLWFFCEVMSSVLSPLISKTYRETIVKDRKLRVEWHSRVVSFIHAIISSAFGISALILEIQAFSDPVSGWTPRFDKVLAFSYGYFIFDLLLITVRYPDVFKGSEAMIAHHFVCLTTLGHILNSRIGTLYGLAGLMTEVTTASYNIRFFLRALGKENSSLNTANDLIFFISFFFCRVVWCFFLLCHMYFSGGEKISETPYIMRMPILAMVFFFVLNVWWFSIMLKKVRRMFSSAPEAKSE